MTHYQLKLEKTGRILRISYDKAGRLCRVRLPALTAEQLRHIGAVLPPRERDMADYAERLAGRVSYSAEAQKAVSIYQEAVGAWMEFYLAFRGMRPRFNAQDGKHLKSILAHLEELSGGDTQQALEAWKTVLLAWEDLEEFHQQNTDLGYINRQINIILGDVKRVTNKKGTVSRDYVGRILDELRS